ncbi:MAG: hypothetical protein ABI794_07960 [Betaproteobacteria bacterium]
MKSMPTVLVALLSFAALDQVTVRAAVGPAQGRKQVSQPAAESATNRKKSHSAGAKEAPAKEKKTD